MATDKDSVVSIARESLRRWPELTLMLLMVVGFGWFIDRRDIRFEQIIKQRDDALAASQQRVLDHIQTNTRVLQRLADLTAPHEDGWVDRPEERPRGG